ncbi:MAG: adenylate/guanylate cyclase domain-containing protein, partial [Tepidiformaceae bacterium]
LETYARMRGAQVLWGRSHEASGAPPYWPWVQVGRQWGGANDLASIQAEVAPTRGELVRLFPELRQQPGFVEPEAVLDPQSAQFRLFDAFATYLRAMAGKGPLVVALDDLHWADKPTLLLLEHVARDLGRLRLLVVCTYRDTDLSRTHPLSEALAALNRDPGFQRVVLRGLSKDEVRAYIREAAHAEPKPAVLEKIFEETEGNPFFLSEVVNLLTQEGTLNRESVSDIAVPDGVKEALGRRLDRLSKEANELLQVAAIAGREFAYDTLSLLGERDEDALLRLIEEGIEARVIEEMEQPGRYRFTHALMQETLLSELSTTRRVRLHGQVGEALELRWGDRAEEYASRLASHFLESSTLTPRHADKARQYAVLAAREAEQKFAWAEAVRWYEAAIAGDEDPEPGVLTALSFGWEFAEERSERSWPIFERALEAYRMRRDVDGFALAVARAPHFVAHASAMYPLVAEAVAQPNTLTSALNLHLRIQLRRADYQSRNDARSVVGPPDLEEQILQLSHVVGGAEGAAARYEVAAMRHLRSGDLATTARNFDDAANECEAAGGADEASYFRIAAAYVAIAGGHLQEASRLSHELRRLSLERGIRSGIAFAAEFLTAVATLRWDLDEIERLIDRARVEAGHWRDPEDFRMIVRVFQGKNPEGWDAALSRGLPAAPQFRIMQMAWASAASAYAGETRASEERFAEWWVLWAVGAGGSPQRAESLVWIALALPHISVQDHILRQIYEETRQWKNWCAFDSGIGIDPARGQLALRLGLVDEAEQAFNDGLEWAEREDCPVELGRNLQGLAAVAESRGDIAGALTLLDRAAGQYQPRGVKLFLDQVIAAKVRLQGITSTYRSSIENVAAAVQGERLAVSEHAAADGTVTLFFSDIEGSTAMNERLGDARWLEVLHAHNTILDGAIQAHGGRTVKTMGDGYMAVFASPEAGVRCALAIQAAFQVPREVLTDVRVRIGIHTGQAVRDQGDFFGREVNYAARVANAAIGGEVVVSEAVRERILGAAGLLISPPSDVEFKGFSGEQPVFRVVAAG